ncbi:MAG: hypothetical protein ABUK01_19075 [Leptospirales bacterium]
MKLQKITNFKDGFVYLYGINSREDFLRAGVKVATNRDYLFTGLTFISSQYGIVVLNSELEVISCEVWETEDDVTKVSYLSKFLHGVLNPFSEDSKEDTEHNSIKVPEENKIFPGNLVEPGDTSEIIISEKKFDSEGPEI